MLRRGTVARCVAPLRVYRPLITLERSPMAYTARDRLLLAAESAARKSTDPSRRKCFLSYHADDVDEVTRFIDKFGDIFIPKVSVCPTPIRLWTAITPTTY